MKSHRVCPACGRRRKPGHEWRVGKEKLAYSPQCLTDAAYREQRDKCAGTPLDEILVVYTQPVEAPAV